MSPRPYVRVDVDGTHDYLPTVKTSAEEPAAPWALPLTDVRGRYWYLAFDLDVKHGNASYDASRLCYWLDELCIPWVACISGPSGGRHVWVALAEAAEPGVVGTIAMLAAQLLPTLDVTPLTNGSTGAVRPPYAPHRHGGRSEPIGPVDALLSPTVTLDQLGELRQLLVDAGASEQVPPAAAVPARGVAVDVDGRPHLVGPKRELSARIRSMLWTAPGADTSHTQGTILAGMARARWRFADVLALLDTAPALEHARTRASIAGARRSRPSRDAQIRALATHWELQVRYVAENPIAGEGADEDFATRAVAIAAAVNAVQARADAMPGRWGADGASRAARAAQGRYSHRAVLDAICLYLTLAVRNDVELSVRRLAIDTGYGREACRLALHALSTPDDPDDPESAWILPVDAAHELHGARYRLSRRFSTGNRVPEWSQVATHPGEATGPEQRAWWSTRLSHRLRSLAHDVFSAPGSLGRTAGRCYALLPHDGVLPALEIAHASGLSIGQVQRALRRLDRAGLARRRADGWTPGSTESLDVAAIVLGVEGYLEGRRRRYEVERIAWGVLQDELTWMRQSWAEKKRSHRRRRADQQPLFDVGGADRIRHPRTSSGRLDTTECRRLAAAGLITAAYVPSAA